MNRTHTLIALIMAIVAIIAFGRVAYSQPMPPSKGQSNLEKALIDLERQWAEVYVTNDTAVLKRILADDFLGTNSKGKVYTKRGEIADIEKEASPEFVSTRLDSVKVRFFGANLAVLHGVGTSYRKAKDGSDEAVTLTWTDTWLKRNGTWQIIASQDAKYP